LLPLESHDFCDNLYTQPLVPVLKKFPFLYSPEIVMQDETYNNYN